MLNQKKLLTKILSHQPSIMSDTDVQTVNVGIKNFNFPFTIPSGYKFLGIAGFSVSYAECSVNQVYWDEANQRIVVQIRNNYATALTVSVTVSILIG